MSDFDSVFSEILLKIKDVNTRLGKFETWEPSTGFVDTGAHVYRATNIALAAGAWRQVAFDGELWDTDSINSAGIFTIPTDGKYLFKSLLWTSGITGITYIRLYKSATEYTYIDYTGTYNGLQISAIFDCNEGDTVQLDVYPVPGVLTVLGNASLKHQSFFQVQRVG